MRKGSAVLWLLLIGLVAFILFNVLKGASVKSLFKFANTTTTYNTYNAPANVPANNYNSNQPAQPAPIPPIGFSANQLSPLYKQAHIDSVIRPNIYSYYSSGGQFAIYADGNTKQPLNITGWSVRGNKSNGVVIPQAIADYSPNTFSASQGTDIILEAGSRVYVYGTKSVIGANFRLNKCTGYLNEKYKFDPSLPNDCPRIDSARLVLLSGKCQDFVRGMNACVTPSPNDLNRISGLVEDECRALINKQNHISCYNDHHGDADFFSKEWRVWVGDPMTFDADHDRLVLYDKQGLVVDEYTY